MADSTIRDTADDAIARTRETAKAAAREVSDAVDELREQSSLTGVARSAGRRIRRLRDEQPIAFAAAVAVTAIVLAGAFARAQR